LLLHKRGVKLNLGCGDDIRKGWVNADLDCKYGHCIELDMRTNSGLKLIRSYAPSVIELNHSVGYLTFNQAINLFKVSYESLANDGLLIIESPCLYKVCNNILNGDFLDNESYLEAVRPLYAFDIDQAQSGESYSPYVFLWTEDFLKNTLSSIGFVCKSERPLMHDRRKYRDIRLVCNVNR